MIDENEDFYIHKNTSNNTFEVLTGAVNQNYSYIDTFGGLSENIPENLRTTYSHRITKTSSILEKKFSLPEIPDRGLYLNAQNIDTTQNSSITDNDSISTWLDLS